MFSPAQPEISYPGLQGIAEEDVGWDQVAVDQGLGSGVVEVGQAAGDPEGDEVSVTALELLGGSARWIGGVVVVPRVGGPILYVGGSGGELVEPTVEVSVSHELV